MIIVQIMRGSWMNTMIVNSEMPQFTAVKKQNIWKLKK